MANSQKIAKLTNILAYFPPPKIPLHSHVAGNFVGLNVFGLSIILHDIETIV